MVALLWDAGDVLAAIELEGMWNNLGRQVRFSLLCSYPQSSTCSPERAAALQRVCALHSEVLHTHASARESAAPRPTRAQALFEGRFDADLTAPREARRGTARRLRLAGCREALVDAATLLVSELASNAVVHAESPFRLEVLPTEGSLRISVEDQSPLGPGEGDRRLVPRRARGLGLVDALSRRWGVQETSGGKIVWAELPS
jgi:anti-sigma regulatory factor (Ser/Thr protein kinase)